MSRGNLVDPRDDTTRQPDPGRRYIPMPENSGLLAFRPMYPGIYDIPSTPELLFEEEALQEGRTWGEDLTLYTGASYLAGATAGAVAGLRRAAVEAERGESLKLRFSRVLNNCGSAGRAYGNRLGVIAMLFSATKSGVRECRSGSRADDWINTAAAGIATGALYRMPGGPRSAIVGGIFGGILAGAGFVAGRPLLKKFAPNLGI
ncbi:hypothetical protein BS78_04G242900 [Paspalum vaginatum]|nr:hypothetical protein BS78_04G242900 [Paspalum vaginatum]